MKLPLLLFGTPSLNVYGPVVHIPAGSWIIESNHKDSSLEITLTEPGTIISSLLVDGEIFKGDIQVQVRFIKIGSEKEITVYAHTYHEPRVE